MIAESFEEEGHEIVDSLKKADKALIGTCVVIDKTEQRMRRRIEELEEEVYEVIVSGCLPSVEGSCFLDNSSEKGDLKFIRPNEVEFTSRSGIDSSIIGTVPIASGCFGDCSYCITKLVRGQLVSRCPEEIKERFEELVESGKREIRITCQDTALYGRDISTDLVDLLDGLLDVEGEYRIRVGMMNVDSLRDIIDEYIEMMRQDRIYTFLHLPLQSGSDRILQKMNRKYNAEGWKEMTARFRDEFPELTLSTDVIAGFPGETEEDFQMTKEVLKEAGPDIVNVTRFSPRRSTEAAKMQDQIDSKEKKRRSKELTDLRFQISRELNESYVGKETSALVIEKGKNDTLKARMDNYKVVVLKEDDESLIGERVDVKIQGAEDIYLWGERLGNQGS